LGVVVFLDFFLVAPVWEKNYAMFSSVLGTWIPFALIFAATYLTGRYSSSQSPLKVKGKEDDGHGAETRLRESGLLLGKLA
jgi:hypothetical protein